jgi:hypothetical protein
MSYFIHLHMPNIIKCIRHKIFFTTACDGITVLCNALYTTVYTLAGECISIVI